MAGLAAAGGVLAAADLDLEMLEAGAELGGEEEVEHLAPLGLGVVGQQARRGPRADGPDAFKDPARRSPVDLDRGRDGRASGAAATTRPRRPRTADRIRMVVLLVGTGHGDVSLRIDGGRAVPRFQDAGTVLSGVTSRH